MFAPALFPSPVRGLPDRSHGRVFLFEIFEEFRESNIEGCQYFYQGTDPHIGAAFILTILSPVNLMIIGEEVMVGIALCFA